MSEDGMETYLPSEAPPPRIRARARALVYTSALPSLISVARDHGYALAVHGSMATDLDLIAVPWTDRAVDAPTLIEALRDCMGGTIPGKKQMDRNPTWKPHGRLAWSIHTSEECGGPYLDVSVMPRRREGEHFVSENEMVRVLKEEAAEPEG